MALYAELGPSTFSPVGDPVVGPVSIAPAVFNFREDFRVITDEPSEVVYNSVRTPRDLPFTIRYAAKPRANIYAGSTIDPTAFLPERRGTDLIVELKGIGAVKDSDDASAIPRRFPYRVALTMTVPDSGAVVADDVFMLVELLMAALPDHGSNDVTAGLDVLLRGILKKQTS